MQVIAPGIWQWTIGQPEEHTPTRHRAFEPCLKTMAQLPKIEQCPFDPANFKTKPTKRGLQIEIPLAESDELYGLGLQLKSHRQTGKMKKLAVNSDPVADTGDSHAPVPVIMSTNGWGIFVNSLRYVTFQCASNQKVSANAKAASAENDIAINTEDLYAQKQLSEKLLVIEVPHVEGVEVMFIGGPDMVNAVKRYNLYSGGGCLPSLWGLGVWYRAFGRFNQDQVMDMAKHLRDRNIPCDVLGLEPGWQTKAYSCSYVWADERFPQPQKLIDDTKAMGYKLNLWEHAFTHPTSPIYDELKDVSGEYEVWKGLVPDFTIQKAFDTFANYHDEQLVSKGITGFKLDECDSSDFVYSDWSFPLLSEFPSGMDGEQYHSLFGNKYMQCIDSTFRKHNLRTCSAVRNAHALASPFAFVLYSDLYDHKDFVRGVVNMGFTGLLWTPEVRHATSPEDLVRRIQAAMLSPQALINAWYISNPPWKQIDRTLNNDGQMMDNWEELEAHCRVAFELRMQLIPYLYAAFAEYQQTGKPPFRALVMDWPNDSETYNLDSQYMCGDDILVAPMFAGEAHREVYLPEGRWHDYYSGKVYDGKQTITVTATLDQIPMFVKDGTLLPLAKPVQHIETDTVFELTPRCFGENCRDAKLYEDDGVTFDHQLGKFNTVTLTANGKLTREGDFDQVRYVLAD